MYNRAARISDISSVVRTCQYLRSALDKCVSRQSEDCAKLCEPKQQVGPLLDEHHNKIQALLEKNPNASRQELGPQIHVISEETHREVHGLLSDHQQQLEKAMQQGEHRGAESRRSVPPTKAS